MKNLILSLLLVVFAAASSPLKAQATDAHEMLKKHINSIVEQVEETESPEKKREILDSSLSEITEALDKVAEKSAVSGQDKNNLDSFKKLLTEKQDELNGVNGYEPVGNNQLDDFADYVQQDIEQADSVVTISVTTALLIIIILLLL